MRRTISARMDLPRVDEPTTRGDVTSDGDERDRGGANRQRWANEIPWDNAGASVHVFAGHCPMRQLTRKTPATQIAMPTIDSGSRRSSNKAQAMSAVTGGVR